MGSSQTGFNVATHHCMRCLLHLALPFCICWHCSRPSHLLPRRQKRCNATVVQQTIWDLHCFGFAMQYPLFSSFLIFLVLLRKSHFSFFHSLTIGGGLPLFPNMSEQPQPLWEETGHNLRSYMGMDPCTAVGANWPLTLWQGSPDIYWENPKNQRE